jgi:hypothetical protein
MIGSSTTNIIMFLAGLLGTMGRAAVMPWRKRRLRPHLWKLRRYAISRMQSGAPLAAALGIPLLTTLAIVHSWRGAFLAISAAAAFPDRGSNKPRKQMRTRRPQCRDSDLECFSEGHRDMSEGALERSRTVAMRQTSLAPVSETKLRSQPSPNLFDRLVYDRRVSFSSYGITGRKRRRLARRSAGGRQRW